MKKEQFIRRMIALYTEALDYAKRSKCNTRRFFVYLSNRDIHTGLCRLAGVYQLEERSTRWIHKYVPKGAEYICAAPVQLNSKREMCESIETRLSVLRKELKKCR